MADDLLDLGAHGLERDAERLQRFGRDAFTLVDEAEQDVLGPDVVVVEEPRFFLREDHDPSCPVGEALEQDVPPLVRFPASGSETSLVLILSAGSAASLATSRRARLSNPAPSAGPTCAICRPDAAGSALVAGQVKTPGPALPFPARSLTSTGDGPSSGHAPPVAGVGPAPGARPAPGRGCLPGPGCGRPRAREAGESTVGPHPP